MVGEGLGLGLGLGVSVMNLRRVGALVKVRSRGMVRDLVRVKVGLLGLRLGLALGLGLWN